MARKRQAKPEVKPTPVALPPLDWAALERELAAIAEGERLLKKRAMIYQVDAKETVAAHYGKTLEEVNLPFAEWMALREKYERETGHKL